jgi:hypothetical protein
MSKVAVVMFDTDMHEISVPGSHYSLVVVGATNEEILEVLVDGGVSVWHEHYLVKAIRVLREAGYEPLVADGVVGITVHEREVYRPSTYRVHDRSHLALDVEEIDEEE